MTLAVKTKNGKNFMKVPLERLERLTKLPPEQVADLLIQNPGIEESWVDPDHGALCLYYLSDLVTEVEIFEALKRPGHLLDPSLRRAVFSFWSERGILFKLSLMMTGLILFFGLAPVFAVLYGFGSENFRSLIVAAFLFAGVSVLERAIRDLFQLRISPSQLVVVTAVGVVYAGWPAEGIVFLVVAGLSIEIAAWLSVRMLRERAQGQAGRFRDVQVWRGDRWIELPLHRVAKGNRILVRQGAAVPVDGFVTQGSGQVDESSVTGESLTVSKAKGDAVRSGTRVVYGSFEMTAESSGIDSTLSRLKEMIRHHESEKARTEFQMERMNTAWCVFLVFLSGGAYLLLPNQEGIIRAAAVLMAGMPLALSLSSPAVFTSGVAAAARMGVFFKSARMMEQLGVVRRIFFDKTGTVTHNRPSVSRIVTFGGASEKEALKVAASAAESSHHPLAHGLIDEAKLSDLPLDKPERTAEFEGGGIAVSIGGKRYKLGAAWLFEFNFPISAEVQTALAQMEQGGEMTVLLGDDNGILAVFGFTDKVRWDAPFTMHQLRRMGVEPILLTGDRETAARKAGAALGMADVRFRMQPEDKITVVTEASSPESPVALVGDGVNDAPALAAADVGIAMGREGTEAAQEAADVILSGDSLALLVTALRSARRTRSVFYQTLIFSILYGMAGLALAYGGILTPPTAIVFQAMGIVLVVLSSLRLHLQHVVRARS